MYNAMARKKHRSTRNAFVRWLAHCRKDQLEEKYDNMCELVTNLWFKQRVFLALRHAALESKTENSILKFKAWKNWCETSKKNKFFEKKVVLVDKIEAIRNERLK